MPVGNKRNETMVRLIALTIKKIIAALIKSVLQLGPEQYNNEKPLMLILQ